MRSHPTMCSESGSWREAGNLYLSSDEITVMMETIQNIALH